MQIIKSLFKLLVFIAPITASAQSTFLPMGDKGYHFVDRLEIKQQTNTDLNFSTLKPLNRRYITRQAEFLDSARMGYKDSSGVDKYKEWTDLELTKVDEYNMRSFLMNNAEWVTGSKEGFESKKPLLTNLYKTPTNLFEVHSKDFFLVINPLIQIHQAVEPGFDQGIFLNSRGLSARGMIANKIGFYTSITDNQERGPRYFNSYVNDAKAVPGVGYYKPFKTTAYDYYDARGYITFNAAKYIDIQFGYDKNFIGNGYRSLFLSDWGNSYLFLKLNTKIWKFNYQNLFMELMPRVDKSRGDVLLERKYAAMHHLSINVTKWLNIGAFESIIFGRKDHFDFAYLNPIIFLRHIEGAVGSPDNALLGFDFKANLVHRVQLYGQILFDEFKLDKLRENRGWWANKYGYQLGVKYVDAFNVPNLDLQFETNRVRPYTYSHNDSISNYSHYNQPLAHPLGANFQEYVARVHYQPAPKWYLLGTIIYYNKGLDSTGYNAGGDIFRLDTDRYGIEEGFNVGGGKKVTCLNATMQLSYELRENLYLDLSYQYRNYKIVNDPTQSSNTSLVTAGIRLNLFKREYDF